MKALTLYQPWASLIAIGAKQFETRSWPAPRTAIGDVVAIHAGRKEDRSFRWEDDEVLSILGEVVQLTSPVPAKGHLGLWTVPEDLVNEILRRSR